MVLDSPGAGREPDATPPPDRLARSAGLAGAATLTSRVLGLVREQVLAGVFGASNEMDAFLVAMRIPNLFRDLFAEGAMSAAFVPTFTRHLAERGKADAWRLACNVITALLLATAVLVVLGIVFAQPLVTLYAPEFADVPGKTELTIRLGRIVLPFLMLAAVAAAFMGMLNSLRHYFMPALAPATFNIATIVCLIVLMPFMPALGLPRITTLAIATIVGGFTQLALQWPLLRAEGFRYRPRLDLRDPGLGQILLLMGPGTIGIAATQINLLVTTQLATYEGAGAVSWLSYAFRLIYLPIGLFGVSIATAVLPAVSRHASGDRAGIANTIGRGLRLMLVVNIPATIGLIVLSNDIIRVLFERGRFLPADTLATAGALRCFAVGLVGFSASRIVSPVFYAFGRSRVAVTVSMLTIALNLTLCLLLVRVIGFQGLALATSLSALASATVLLLLLRRHLGQFDVGGLLLTLGKAVLAAAGMAVTTVAVSRGLAVLWPEMTFVPQAVRIVAAIGAGLLTLAAAARVLRIDELNDLVASAARRLTGARV